MTFRVYLCSGFADMQAERAHLHQVVFPELRRHWGTQGVNVEIVDLRWGANSAEVEGAATLERALAEVERCRPWFLALLGDRYGPVLAQVPEHALRRFPWLRGVDPTSLLEMEIVHGFLLHENPPRPGLFYFRDPAFLIEVPADQRRKYVEENAASAARLVELKQALRGSPQALVRAYGCRWDFGAATLKALTRFGKQVAADLGRAIEIEREMAGVCHAAPPRISPRQFAPPIPPAPRPVSMTVSFDDESNREMLSSELPAPALPRKDEGPGQAATETAMLECLLSAEVTRGALAAELQDLAEIQAVSRQPLYVDENVQFTVYRPRVVQPGKWYPLLAFAHLAERRPDAPPGEPDPLAEVYRQATEVLARQVKGYHDVTQDSRAAVPREGEITFVPEVPGVEFNPPRRTFCWQESVHREEFRLRAAPELDGKVARGRLTVFLGSLILADISLTIKVDSQARAAPEDPSEKASARPYRRIFASYSHRDLHIVQQVEHFTRAMGDEYVRDWTHLRAGEVWNDRLMQLIEQADVFQLFWSTNSMQSAYVRREWEHALSLGRPNFIRPVYWEEPLPSSPDGKLPPEELRRIHFQKLYVEALSHPAMRQPETAAGAGAVTAPAAPAVVTAEGSVSALRREEAFPLGADFGPGYPPGWGAGPEDSGVDLRELPPPAPAAPPPAPPPAAARPPAPRPTDASDWRTAPPPARARPSEREEQAEDREAKARRRVTEPTAPPARAAIPPQPLAVSPALSRRDEDEDEEGQPRMPALSKYRTRGFPWFLVIVALMLLLGLAFLIWRFLL
jgi:hypothetical protein